MAKQKYAHFLEDPATYAGMAPDAFGIFGFPERRKKFVEQARDDPNKFVTDHGIETAEGYGADAPGLMQAVASQKALDAQRDAQRRRTLGGRQSTILTGGRGLMTPAPVSRKQILG